jgi:hypothetical protein
MRAHSFLGALAAGRAIVASFALAGKLTPVFVSWGHGGRAPGKDENR